MLSTSNAFFCLSQIQRDENGHESEGEILVVAPRDPQHAVSYQTNETSDVDPYPFDEKDRLHQGMVLREDDVS